MLTDGPHMLTIHVLSCFVTESDEEDFMGKKGNFIYSI